MTTFELLSQLRALDVRLWLEDDGLRFNAPKDVLTPVLRGEIAQRKAEIVALLRQVGAGDVAFERLPRRGELPLSFAQQRLWFLVEFEPGATTFNLPVAAHLRGVLDRPALEAGLGEIVRRHEVLRTTFPATEGRPRQAIAPRLGVPMPVVDLGRLAADRRRAVAGRLASEAARTPFDLARGPLLRTLLLRLAEAEHWFVLNVHHIVFDRWSMGILSAEMAVLYGVLAGRGSDGVVLSPLPELPFQYVDFTHWQRRWLRGGVLKALVDHWRRRLAGAPAILPLPIDRPRPPVRTSEGARCPVALPAELTPALRELSRAHDVTLFMTLLAAFKTLLWRTTGQTDLSVGTVIANRNRPEIEKLIGFFVNTLALRSDLAGNPGFDELLEQVRKVTVDAYGHQDLPFEKLVEELQPERQMSYSPLFQVMLVLHNTPPPTLELAGLEVEPVEIAGGVWSSFDLTLSLWEEGGELRGDVTYSPALFDVTTMVRLVSHFRTLLAGLAVRPGARCGELPLLAPGDRHQLLVDWNDTAAERLPPRCVHELIAARAAECPEAKAVVAEDGGELTYGELVARADELARRLRRHGVKPEVRVGVSLTRSPAMVAALLGVLRAGGAYVPLDPSYPRARRAFMVKDAKLAVLVTEKALVSDLPSPHPAVVLVDADEPPPGPVPMPRLGQDHCAYAIYTSGSTGRPKGTQITHRGLVNFLLAMAERPGLGADDVLLAVTSLSFDIAALELLLPLVVGARIELASADTAVDGMRLRARLGECGATVVQATPATWRLLLAAGWEGDPGLRVLCGGEVLPADLAAALTARSAVVWNLYGPTETTVWSLAGPRRRGPVTIGRPIANTRVYLLDRELRPVPPGAVGEILIGGVGLARGYLHRPRLTAEKFVPDPFAAGAGERLFRTGDLGRFRRSGEVEFLGRIDNQIKLRGHRIELGEIEAVLCQHPGVRQAVVALREDRPGEPRLAAYLVPAGEPLAVNELQEYLHATLPDYMVPSAFVVLPALPLTPTRKVDRRALPRPQPEAFAPAAEHLAPRTPIEEMLAVIWNRTLGLERVGMESNFFALGGHSLLATRVVSQIREVFQVELPVRTVFEQPTIAALAAGLDDVWRAGPGLELVPVPRDQRLPLSYAQLRQWHRYQRQPGTRASHMPTAVRVRGAFDPRILAATVNAMVRRHESLRTTFPVPAAGEPEQRIARQLTVAVPLVDLTRLDRRRREAAAEGLVAAEATRPFDLVAGPLLRITVLRLGGEDHVVALTLHNIIADAWSMDVLQRETFDLYAAFRVGKRSPLPALRFQYADFAVAQRRWLAGETLSGLTGYWREQLSGRPQLRLPVDRPGGGEARTSSWPMVVDGTVVPALKALSNRLGASLFMTLLAAFQALLRRYAGQDEVTVGTLIAGRNWRQTEPLIGYFVNTLALATDVGGDPTFEELLGRVREVTLGAYEHQDLPFEMLAEALEAGSGSSPLVQAMLMVQNVPRSERRIAGLQVSPFGSGEARCGCELALWFSETNGQLAGSLEYRADLFDRSTIRRLGRNFRVLLGAAVAAPGEALSALPATTAAERHQVVAEWSRSPRTVASARRLLPAPAGDPQEVYVLDPGRRPVPIGAVGELCVGGPAPGAGTELVPHPRSAAPGDRLVRTGVLARFRSDGTLEPADRR